MTKEAGRKFIEAGEQAAIGVVADIRGKVLNIEDAREGIQSFVERRAAVFKGALSPSGGGETSGGRFAYCVIRKGTTPKHQCQGREL